ncbi:CLOCK-interacting pacemaker-like [Ambystoma mexicanum]|uniref:CLOCK-interacting pacemaker-like n=1 Tax=Ambystoma mexicanum TaxID=8296 RepID=UPI0037E77661
MAPEAPSPGVVSQPTSESIEAPVPISHVKDPTSKKGSPGTAETMDTSPDEMKKRPGKATVDNEKDSGFSDTGSDDLSNLEQTDSEDGSTNRSGRSVELAWQAKPPEGTSSAFTSLTPVYILKNVIVQQPMNGAQFLQSQMAWRGPHTMDANASQTRVIIIQPPMASAAPNLWPVKKKSGKRAYLPILKALPKIAPHPSKDVKTESPLPATPRDNVSGPSKSKRMRMATYKESATKHIVAPTNKQHESREKLAELPPSPGPRSPSPLPQSKRYSQMATSPTSDCGSSATPSAEPSSHHAHSFRSINSYSPSNRSEAETLARVSRKLASNLKKQRRFHNTVDVLKKSGLLGITLKTKELIGRNKATQRDISELKEHTRLFCEAVKSNDSNVWAKLQEAMNLSSCYCDMSGSSATNIDSAGSTDNSPMSSPDASPKSSPGSSVDLALDPDFSQGLPPDTSVKI